MRNISQDSAIPNSEGSHRVLDIPANEGSHRCHQKYYCLRVMSWEVLVDRTEPKSTDPRQLLSHVICEILFHVVKRTVSGRPQKCEDEQLQELLDDDPTQTQRQLAEALHVSQETISRRAAVYEQWEKSINSVNGSHMI
ncbi:hypothetical protein P5V15_006937 [Pogonomyrmex californicus]